MHASSRHALPLALAYGRRLRVFRAHDLNGTVGHDRTDSSYCRQPWHKQRPDKANGQRNLQDTVSLMLDDDVTDVPLVNKTLHGRDHISTRYLKLFTVSLKLVSSWCLWFGLRHNDSPLSHAARVLFLDSNISNDTWAFFEKAHNRIPCRFRQSRMVGLTLRLCGYGPQL